MDIQDIVENYLKRALVKNELGNFLPSSLPESAISAWYEEARKVEKIEIHFDEFKHIIEKRITPSHYWDFRRYGYRGPGRHPDTPRQKYQKKSHHRKKELSEDEIRKRDWRERQNDPRDQNAWHWGQGGEYKKFSVRKGRSAERRDMKQELRRMDWSEPDEAWDGFIERDRKNYVDPWDWW